jgi:hypothetical protein
MHQAANSRQYQLLLLPAVRRRLKPDRDEVLHRPSYLAVAYLICQMKIVMPFLASSLVCGEPASALNETFWSYQLCVVDSSTRRNTLPAVKSSSSPSALANTVFSATPSIHLSSHKRSEHVSLVANPLSLGMFYPRYLPIVDKLLQMINPLSSTPQLKQRHVWCFGETLSSTRSSVSSARSIVTPWSTVSSRTHP